MSNKAINQYIFKNFDVFQRYTKGTYIKEVGYVVQMGDGIAQVFGLNHVVVGEILKFNYAKDKTAIGIALNLEEQYTGVVVLSDANSIVEGTKVERTGQVATVPVGSDMLGRVLDPLTNDLDGKGSFKTDELRLLEPTVPGIIDRQSVCEPLQTGIVSIDSIIPIGRGQRELIIGDRQTGKTTIALDTIINQKTEDVVCVYVAIGQKASSVAQSVRILQEKGALEYSVIIAANADAPAPMQYIAPYVGASIAEHFMYQGKHTLVIYDDLTKQAQAYRQMSLLLRRTPGRELSLEMYFIFTHVY